MPPPSQEARRDKTRTALIDAGHRLFAERGFAAVPADEIVAAAGVTRGALHHHFKDKRGLFKSVFEELEADIADELGRLIGDGEDQLLRRALSAFLDVCERPDVYRIALTDAPAVLGWKTWREIESQHGLGLLTALLEEGRTDDTLASRAVLAQLVLGAVIEAALVVANAHDRVAARQEVETSLLEMFGQLLD